MASYNKVTLLGNLTRDPEQRVTPNGVTITKFGMAVNRKWKDGNGEAREKATFVDVDSFGKPAELISQYCSKGDLLLIDGRLELDQWETESGEKRQKLKIVLENFQLMPRSVQGESGGGESRRSSPPRRREEPAAPEQPELPEVDDDDVPF